jgi:hypothetical protein
MVNRLRALETTGRLIEQVRLERGAALGLTVVTDTAEGPRMALVVLDPTLPQSRIRVRIEAGPDTVVDQLVDVAEGIELVCVSLPESARDEVKAVLEARRGGAIASVHIIAASKMPEIPVPLAALGHNLDHEIPIINRALRSMVASMLQSPANFKRSPLYAKIYICGAGKKNHGNPNPPIPDGGSGCPIVNVVICGKKKDKNIAEEVMSLDFERNDGLEFLMNGDIVPASGIIAYIQFIMDGGMLDDVDDNFLSRFNELARITRSVASSISEIQ